MDDDFEQQQIQRLEGLIDVIVDMLVDRKIKEISEANHIGDRPNQGKRKDGGE